MTTAAAANPITAVEAGIAQRGGRTAFVGRTREMHAVRTAVEAACAGRGQLVLLAGEAGIGKTRLAEEAARYSEACGTRVLWGRCWEGEGAPSFWPWVQIVRAYVRERDAAGLLAEMGPGVADIAHVVPEVRLRLPDLPPPATSLDGEETRGGAPLTSVSAMIRARAQWVRSSRSSLPKL